MSDDDKKALVESFGHCRDYLALRTAEAMKLCDDLILAPGDTESKARLLLVLTDIRQKIGWMTGDEEPPVRRKVDYV